MTFDFTHYHNICAATATADNLFENFRSETTFRDMYEHATVDQGSIYLEEIKKVPAVFERIMKLSTNDQVGNPPLHYYDEIGMNIAPTTLRYIKVLADLVRIFGSLDDMNIVEIGGGYGGQCKIIHDMFKVKSYTLVDLPYAVALAQRYLKEFGIRIRGNKGPYDLFISNYAFTEIERPYQDVYTERFIRKSKRGYMTCNFYRWEETNGMLSFGEILKLMPGGKVMEEIPLTAKDNFIYTWNTEDNPGRING